MATDPNEDMTPLKSLVFSRSISPFARELPESLSYQEYLSRLEKWETLYVLHDSVDDPEETILTRVDSEEEFVALTSDIVLLWGVYAIMTEDACYS